MSALFTIDADSSLDAPNFNINLGSSSSRSSCISKSNHEADVETYERVKNQLNINENESIIITGAGKGFPIVYVSDGWVDMCGWSKTEACGRGGGINQGEGTNSSTLQRIGKSVARRKGVQMPIN